MKVLTKPMQRAALAAGISACLSVATTAHAEDNAPTQTQAPAKAKPKKAKKAPPPSAAEPAQPPAAAAKVTPVAPAPKPEPPPLCTLGEAEQPRGGKLDVLGEHFGSAPVVRIAGKPARILLRKQDRISVQIPADSDGGPITLTDEKKNGDCGTLVIIGKDR
ncbi:MAG TPA: hypothetical protein VFN67_19835 [Polyangiales bacterium]|jgi:hypothetical protein|nr:hypothetical protein [Polyangiales bacterium]